jgi:Major Facilitator Superfamily
MVNRMMTYKRNHFNRNHIAHQAGQPVRRGRIDSDTRWLLGLGLARIGFTLIFHTYAATQPVLMRSWNLSASQAGWLHAGFYLGYLISLAGVGVLADRYGAKRMILLPGIVASGSAFLCAVFARDFYSGLVSYGTCALFLGGSYTPVLTVISQRIAVNRRGRAIGWYIATGALGHALSLFLSGGDDGALWLAQRLLHDRVWPCRGHDSDVQGVTTPPKRHRTTIAKSSRRQFLACRFVQQRRDDDDSRLYVSQLGAAGHACLAAGLSSRCGRKSDGQWDAGGKCGRKHRCHPTGHKHGGQYQWRNLIRSLGSSDCHPLDEWPEPRMFVQPRLARGHAVLADPARGHAL